jgi:hypothetical protein
VNWRVLDLLRLVDIQREREAGGELGVLDSLILVDIPRERLLVSW